ncbi:hydrolase 1, exosortase A system-associated [Hydrogenophaga sp. PBL-H3]|uniref:hydrolase 1, exosortase A system-associated n=1 Tax=Hydrogenophaga sp. PBL-H3 TaxID=434010 RepID=UPI00131F93BE|nr:hydrolase 1, exosortase A system-associated [Hydrogenophaga sp. PBL-H3]QHE76693.1 hydrolase 1, exosortase A system-associated [Hydrogenophaga sp. PBL-H3]QHE81117.1 hydrolase 1, exosortase A system-associated [Hydrogenophaga sp. PBL-H3]
MRVREQAIQMIGPEADMLGIVSLPPEDVAAKHTAVVIVVGGAQYRVGSHRQFVQLARRLAAEGHPVLRFDLPGMGDSPGILLPFEATSDPIGLAIDALYQHCPGVDQVVLWGLCDGASASVLYLRNTQDPRVVGLALLNPWVRSEASHARVRVKHYYRQRLLDPSFWRKLLGGQVGWQALRGLGHNLIAMRRHEPTPLSFQDAMAEAWKAFPGAILLLLSERDLVAKEFHELAQSDARWLGSLERSQLFLQHIQGADHTCSTTTASRQMESFVLSWLRQIM